MRIHIIVTLVIANVVTGALLSRQLNPSDIPPECSNACTAAMNLLASCNSPSCLCTTSSETAIQTCGNCVVPLEPNLEPLLAPYLQDFNALCTGLPPLTFPPTTSTISTTPNTDTITISTTSTTSTTPESPPPVVPPAITPTTIMTPASAPTTPPPPPPPVSTDPQPVSSPATTQPVPNSQPSKGLATSATSSTAPTVKPSSTSINGASARLERHISMIIAILVMLTMM
jgi:hypothetical protein